MQSFLAACALAIIVAVGASYVLDSVQQPAEVGYTSPSGVRL
jgi:hypothetical protein